MLGGEQCCETLPECGIVHQTGRDLAWLRVGAGRALEAGGGPDPVAGRVDDLAVAHRHRVRIDISIDVGGQISTDGQRHACDRQARLELVVVVDGNAQKQRPAVEELDRNRLNAPELDSVVAVLKEDFGGFIPLGLAALLLLIEGERHGVHAHHRLAVGAIQAPVVAERAGHLAERVGCAQTDQGERRAQRQPQRGTLGEWSHRVDIHGLASFERARVGSTMSRYVSDSVRMSERDPNVPNRV